MAGGKGKIDEYNKSITADERKANASKAGKASGESRNLQARLKEWAESGGYEKMLAMAEDEIAKGNTKMWELVRDTIGEKPIEKSAQINVDAEYQQAISLVKEVLSEDD